MSSMPAWTEATNTWVVVGEQILGAALARFQPLVIVGESPVRVALANELADLRCHATVDSGQPWTEVEIDSSQVPTVVGLGGGAAMDWAKLVAAESGLDLVLAPTATSTNSIFTQSMRSDDRDQGQGEIHRVEAAAVILDLEVMSKAPPRLNAAGLADALAAETAMFDWADVASSEGTLPELEKHELLVQAIVDALVELAREYDPSSQAHCLETLRLLYEGVRLFESSGGPLGAGYEHLFAWNLENVTGRHFIHGEAVALGIVLAHVLRARELDVPLAVLDGADVRWRPSQLGVSDDELVRTVDTVGRYNKLERRLSVPLADEIPIPTWRESLRLAS